MTKFKKILLGLSVLGGLALGISASGACLTGSGGGTGICAASSTSNGYVPVVASTTPFLTYTLQPFPTSSSATTTINGVSGPTFTFSIVATTSASSITTTTAQLFLNLLYYSSSSQITITPTGTIVFATTSISQFINDSGYLTHTIVGGLSQSGGANSLASTTIIGNTTTTALTITGIQSALVATNATGHAFDYPGATCVSGQAIHSLSAAGAVSCLPFAATSSPNTWNATQTYSGNVIILPTSTLLATDSTGQIVPTSSSAGGVSYVIAYATSSASTPTSTATAFVVPAGVNSLIVTLNGAAGATVNGNAGGNGGQQKFSLKGVVPGSTYYYYVGNHGIQSSSANGNAGAGGTGGGAIGGQGGEMSWFSATSTFSTTTVLAVSSGGGGGNGGCNSATGGNGGGTTGTAGTTGNSGGGGGTQSAGGAASITATTGTAGSAGAGGAGGAGGGGCGGGGGGGGYFGGGGGTGNNSGSTGGGGGGSSFVTSTNMLATSTTSGGGAVASSTNSSAQDGLIFITMFGTTL